MTRRLPTELADVLRRPEVPGAFIDKELSKMNEAVCLPTASRSMLGVLNEYVHLAGHVHAQQGVDRQTWRGWRTGWPRHQWVRYTSGTAAPTGSVRNFV